MPIKQFTDSEKFWNEVLDLVSEAYSERENNFRLAMSGGSAANLLTVLREKNFDWSATELWQVDERFVPNNHDDSNVKLLEAKMQGCEVVKKYIPILENRPVSTGAYTKMLQEDKDGYLFDLSVLGVGPDGHTASLFPNSPALNSAELVVATETDAFAVRERIGLGFAAIAKSRHVLVLMQGAGKKEIFAKIVDRHTDKQQFPACRLLALENVHLYWCG